MSRVMKQDKKHPLSGIVDGEGWCYGIKAALKQAWGTDTEVRIRHNGIHPEAQTAKGEIGRMSQEAEALLESLEDETDHPMDSVDMALEALIRDL